MQVPFLETCSLLACTLKELIKNLKTLKGTS